MKFITRGDAENVKNYLGPNYILTGQYRRGWNKINILELLVVDESKEYHIISDDFNIGGENYIAQIIHVPMSNLAYTILMSTGPTNFIKMINERANQLNIDLKNSPFDSEEDIFIALRLTYVPPEERDHLKRLPLANFDGEPPKIGKNYSLTEIICGQVRGSGTCNYTSAKISNALVRVAATRIFADPYQSIMEPIVNSVDSYKRLMLNPSSSVGKYGMGFFSLFYWLIGNPETTLHLISKTSKEFWWVVFRDDINDGLIMTFQDPAEYYLKDIFHTNETGTMLHISLVHSAKSEKFQYHINRLSHISDVEILNVESPGDIMQKVRDGKMRGMPQVGVSLHSFKSETLDILVYDQAEGISSNILLNSVIIPTSSTKTVIASLMASDEEITVDILPTKDTRNLPGLNIAVNNVIVVSISIPNQSIWQYYINLPSNTPLPVSRDDVIVEGLTSELLLKTFSILIDITIERGDDLELVFQHFKAYADYSGQGELLNIIAQIRYNILSRHDLILVPNQILVNLLRPMGVKIARMGNVTIMDSKRKLDNLFDAMFSPDYGYNFFKNVRVIKLEGKFSPTSAGFPGYIFIDSNLSNPNILISSYPNAILRSVNDEEKPLDFYDIYLESIWEKLGDNFIFYNISYGNKNQTTSITYLRSAAIPYAPDGIDYKSNLDYELPIIRPLIQKNEFIGLMSDHYNLFAFLYFTIEAQVAKWGRDIAISLVAPPMILSTNYIRIVDYNSSIKIIKLSNIIFSYCYLATYLFTKYYPRQDEIREYIMYLIQNFSQIRLVISPNVSKLVVMRYYHPMNFYTHNSSNKKRIYIKDEINSLSDKARELLRNGFFDSPRPYLNNAMDITQQNFCLMDARFFPLNSLHNLKFELFYKKDEIPTDDYVAQYNTSLLEVIEKANSCFEAVVVYNSIAIYVSEEGENDLLLNNFSGLVDMVFAELRQRFPLEFFSQYLRTVITESEDKWIIENVYKLLAQTIRVYLNIYHPTNPLLPEDNSRMVTQFDLKKLLAYVYNKEVEIETFQDLVSMGEELKKFIPYQGPNLQVVEIAVSSGTSKPFVASVITELVQNSLDAISQAIVMGKAIRENVEVDLDVDREHNHFNLSIRDYIGIPPSAIIAILIPFLSTKSAQDAFSTGEMGTGFFNSYRQPWCKKVSIRSADWLIEGNPVGITSSVTDNIIYNVSHVDNFLQGTRITIHSNKLKTTDLMTINLDTHIFANNYLGLLARPVIFNGRKLSQTLKKIYSEPTGNVYVIDDVNGSHQSILLTNGVPFGLLITFYESLFGQVTNNLLSTNAIIDINKGYYLPVQSRNKINIPPSTNSKMNEIESFLLRASLYISMCKISNFKPHQQDIYIPGISSDTSLSNFGRSLTNFRLVNDKTPFAFSIAINKDFPNIDSITEHLMNYYAKNGLKPTRKLNKDILKDKAGWFSNSCIQNIIDVWFENKKSFIERKMGSSSSSTTPVVSVSSRVQNTTPSSSKEKPEWLLSLLNYYQRFINAYYEAIKSGQISGLKIGPIPLVEADFLEPSDTCIYVPGKNKFILNMLQLTLNGRELLREWSDYLSLLESKKLTAARLFLSTNRLRDYIGVTTSPAASLIHEIFHNANGDSHLDKMHKVRKYFLDGESQESIDFETEATALYIYAIKSGLNDRLTNLQTESPDKDKIIEYFCKIYGIDTNSANNFFELGYRSYKDLLESGKLTDVQKLGLYWRSHMSTQIPRSEMDLIVEILKLNLNPQGINFDVVGSYRRRSSSSAYIEIIIPKLHGGINIPYVLHILKSLIVVIFIQDEKEIEGMIQIDKDKFLARRINIKILDLFIYPYVLLHNTGTEKFNQQMKLRALNLNLKLNQYGLYDQNDRPFRPVKNEKEIFEFLKIKYLEPWQRNGLKDLEILS